MANEQSEMFSVADGENYRRVSEPFASVDEANAALNAFAQELYELRNKHRLADVSVIIRVPMLEKGEETAGLVAWHYGSSNHRLPMLAETYGRAKAEFESDLRQWESIGRLNSSKPKKKRGTVRTTGHVD